MSEVKSPYNFVPAPNEEKKEVFLPDWSNQVNHDIPFEDGESGSIEFSITAHTPIFIRNGHSKEIADQAKEILEKNGPISSDEKEVLDKYLSFSNIEKKKGKKEYFIPATSIKGMIRNVLEILSKGRIKQISDDKYSFRDLTKNSLYMRSYKSNNVECGWLFEDKNGDWKIEDCGKPLRISHEDLDPILKTRFRNEFLNKNPIDKTAKYKYDQVKSTLTHRFKILEDEYKTLAIKDKDGIEGTIVLTGQSSRRTEAPNRKSSGKFYEFVFLKSKVDKLFIEITEKQKKDFKFIYLDHDSNNISKDWKFWKRKLEKGERVPIFFNRLTSIKVKHFGLAYMYKLPYEYSIHETLPYNSYDFYKKDLAESIFGTTDKETEAGALKGRVMVSHAFSDNATPTDELSKEILASPKASYFPFYIDQSNTGNHFRTFMNNGAQIRGFKRYPIHRIVKKRQYDQNQLNNPNVFSFFRPLKTGAKFNCIIRFHNLKKVEIGALLSSITLHQQGDKFFHSIGAAKPFGYGKVATQIEGLKYLNHPVEDYLIAFENIMEAKFPQWINSPSLTELLAMASEPKDKEQDDQLVYPLLSIPDVPRREGNEFINYKKDGLSLPKYSEVIGISKLVSIEQKVATMKEVQQGDMKLEGSNVRGLKKFLNKKNIAAIPDILKPSLENKIKTIYQDDRKTKKDWDKIEKSYTDLYEWHTIINNWLGEDRAFELYKEITGKDA